MGAGWPGLLLTAGYSQGLSNAVIHLLPWVRQCAFCCSKSQYYIIVQEKMTLVPITPQFL